ncbi:hypothetical protein KM1_002120 [Entamoeba histolytica HM-3:IMSS]|uniref:Uncharacterized protein n=6 Tax=Entamoeba histolytica TaxID=5759 RepID=C4LST7_ENTH1|nr:hypothetical protein EHI_152500 [Entamoeba histolytica HM-1:IMSS]EMD49274.1 Hypothetical protein EHI5A_000770 [Entamoeba histolytica KU27]EMS10818.1 hypothetical protein KM1_002120 [Entamoeba histolytica HM-3:IMSS]ENY61912.1 hypothetical protein EHI7A_018660 [Entamoeba histolytica HM-1:IMSS-A]GAT91503.1 hypothetical protein CL6EHI_152500 [Entamoeba histolytica]EAL51579.1 hypothetical protein EHI_152500 [Entamoeba histolytica HM-1:IMSS]|eukprot:XP_656961.1 hypothetical protein EHI_152500 [Entamoeba histolytica HM-1:IMSS]
MIDLKKIIMSLVVAFILTFTNAEEELEEEKDNCAEQYDEMSDKSVSEDVTEEELEEEEENETSYESVTIDEYDLIDNRSSFDDNDIILIQHFNELESNGEYHLFSLSHYCKDNLMLNESSIQYHHLFKQLTICRTLLFNPFDSV